MGGDGKTGSHGDSCPFLRAHGPISTVIHGDLSFKEKISYTGNIKLDKSQSECCTGNQLVEDFYCFKSAPSFLCFTVGEQSSPASSSTLDARVGNGATFARSQLFSPCQTKVAQWEPDISF